MGDLSASDLKAAMDRGEVQLIDVREAGEFAREHIPGASLAPLSTFDATQLRRDPGKRLVVHCLSGKRAAQAIAKLQAAGVDASSFSGGIAAWKQAGYPLAENRAAPLPIMRQVQITAGSLALLGVVLGFTVHPGFFLLSGAIGAGLMLAGITGSCMMATLLMKLPYNRA